MCKSYNMQPDQSFAALDKGKFQNHIPGMVQIIQKMRHAGCPISLVDDILKIIEQEIKTHNFNPRQLPRYQSSMLKIVQLFPVPRPAMISVPMELTPSEIKQKIQLKAPTFPVFNFIHQLQDLLDAKEFCHLGNLSVSYQPSETQCGVKYGFFFGRCTFFGGFMLLVPPTLI